MYAIIKTGGKQYPVEAGDRLFVEKLDVEPGAKIEFDKVLYLRTDDSAEIGTPYLDAVRVNGTAVESGKAKKVVTFKYKAKKDYRKKQGHRQPYTLVEIDDITVDGKVVSVKAEKTSVELSKEEPEAEEKTETTVETAFEGTADASETEDAKPSLTKTEEPKAEKSETDDAAVPAKKTAAKKKAKAESENADATPVAPEEE
jgi:large subunit ribosomal protein L21